MMSALGWSLLALVGCMGVGSFIGGILADGIARDEIQEKLNRLFSISIILLAVATFLISYGGSL